MVTIPDSGFKEGISRICKIPLAPVIMFITKIRADIAE